MSSATIFLFAVIGCLCLFSGTHGNSDSVTFEFVGLTSFTGVLYESHSNRGRRAIIPTSSITKVGDCSFDMYQNKVVACSSLLYKGYRNKTKKTTCREQIPKYMDCLNAIIRKCYSDPHIVKLAADAMSNALKSMNFTQIACDQGGYPDSVPAEFMNLCRNRMQVDYTKCISSFKKMFLTNRADPKLCAENIKATKCITDTMEIRCKGESIRKALETAKKLIPKLNNPFCYTVNEGRSST